MRRTAVALATALLAAVAPAAHAAPVHVLGQDGDVRVLHDPHLPPPDPMPLEPATTALRGAPPVARTASTRTVKGELRRLRRSGEIDRDLYRDSLRTWNEAKASLGRVTGRRYVELGAILRTTQSIAANGGLTAGRVPVLFEIVRRNREWWTTGSLLAYGARVRFTGDRLVWQSYPGNGIQPQWLGTFGEANAFWKSKRNGALEEILDDTVPYASSRAGGIAWESFFAFSGSGPGWVSGLSQGTGIQALSRAAQRLDRPDFLRTARQALGIFETPPPSGVRVERDGGAHYLIYSGSPSLFVLNAFIQALNGLYDYADISGDPKGRRLFKQGERAARAEVPRYDTGAWSLYEGSRESSLDYHQLVRQFLEGLCDRTQRDVYCETAERFARYETEPPTIRILTSRGRTKQSLPVRFTLSKMSTASLFVNDVPIASASGLARGTHTLTWAGRAKPGEVNVRIDATDLAGNKGSVAKIVRLRRAK
ncbi:MAG TPA: D-glucuronyl C5-epimerase family protein [Capillimicrobium sp.]|nr:D-glucuronyl C5-epimerase family protein [Capillimicrobium sp.]